MSYNILSPSSQLPSLYTPKRRTTLDTLRQPTSFQSTPKAGGYSRKLSITKSKVLTEPAEVTLETKRLDTSKLELIGSYMFSNQVGFRLTQAISEELRRFKGVFEDQCFAEIMENPEQTSPYTKDPNPKHPKHPTHHHHIKPKQPSTTSQPQHPSQHTHQSLYHRIRTLGKQTVLQSTTRALQLPPSTNNFNQSSLNLFLNEQKLPVSVWAPPQSYPRFVAYFSLGKVYQTAMKIKVIRIEKFYTPNYVAPGTMFEELLEFVRRRVDAAVQVLEVGTTKGVYQSKFRKWGWEVKGIKGSQWRIWYRSEQPQA